MTTSDREELWNLKIALLALSARLRDGVEGLDKLTSRVIARALEEMVQETAQIPAGADIEELEEWAADLLVSTQDMQVELARKWEEEMQPNMDFARERAASLGHELADFTCLSADGQTWGAICINCYQWLTISPQGISANLLKECPGD